MVYSYYQMVSDKALIPLYKTNLLPTRLQYTIYNTRKYIHTNKYNKNYIYNINIKNDYISNIIKSKIYNIQKRKIFTKQEHTNNESELDTKQQYETITLNGKVIEGLENYISTRKNRHFHSMFIPDETINIIETIIQESSSSNAINKQNECKKKLNNIKKVFLTPKEIVNELDKYIIGQNDAKRAVSLALRNRWRRNQLNTTYRNAITPKNILMIGPTGCGKTEIARRLAKLTNSPFIKVEATKFTETGFHGKDVESIIKELIENSVRITKDSIIEENRSIFQDCVDSQILDKIIWTLTLQQKQNCKDTTVLNELSLHSNKFPIVDTTIFPHHLPLSMSTSATNTNNNNNNSTNNNTNTITRNTILNNSVYRRRTISSINKTNLENRYKSSVISNTNNNNNNNNNTYTATNTLSTTLHQQLQIYLKSGKLDNLSVCCDLSSTDISIIKKLFINDTFNLQDNFVKKYDTIDNVSDTILSSSNSILYSKSLITTNKQLPNITETFDVRQSKINSLFTTPGKYVLPISYIRRIFVEREILHFIDTSSNLLDQLIIQNAEQNGIVFIDEIDKICTSEKSLRTSADASDEGVQRDQLPIIEGSAITTQRGTINTDHILFITSGAFHQVKPSDLLVELQGRLPIRVHLTPLTEDDLYHILSIPEENLIKQHVALLSTEGINLKFDNTAIREIAHIAYELNLTHENIGMLFYSHTRIYI